MAIILQEIRESGPLPFSRFQDLALYHPEFGYYSRGAGPGRGEGDFLTAPEISAGFGELVGVQVAEMAGKLGHPPDFQVVECGGGRGSLAASLLDSWKRSRAPLYRPAVYHLVERSAALEEEQRRALAGHGDVVVWDAAREDGPGRSSSRPPGVILMNEVLDALPVDRIVRGRDGLEEICVGVRDGRLVEVRQPLREDLMREVSACLPAGCGSLAPGQQVEIRPGLARFLRQAAARIGRGYLLVIDYGLPAAELYGARRKQGTLLAYFQHQATEDLLSRVGWQDLTAHVDLTRLTRAAAELRFRRAGETTQMRFLLALGLGTRIETLAAGEQSPARVRERVDLTALIRPGGMGDLFRVWIGARQASAEVAGLREPDLPSSQQ